MRTKKNHNMVYVQARIYPKNEMQQLHEDFERETYNLIQTKIADLVLNIKKKNWISSRFYLFGGRLKDSEEKYSNTWITSESSKSC